jgi:tryptophan synthase beta chain
MADTATEKTVYLVNLSGRGDKDLAHVHALLSANENNGSSIDQSNVKHRGES